MENLDVAVLRQLRDWRHARRSALLATVVRTWGSSPRPVGSIMALGEGGMVIGSVSGGCIEDDLIERYSRDIPPGLPSVVRYGVSAEEAHRFGLPCGGTLELVLEFNPDAAQLDELLQLLSTGTLVRRTLHLADGSVSLSPAQAPEELRIGDDLVNLFGPEYRMLLIGGGQLAECLATMALFSGFEVTVCDPREEYRKVWRLEGVRLVKEMPDDAVRTFRPDRRSCVVALTHDPKLDDLALLEALYTQAFYVGAIGSRRNQQARRERLQEHFDVSDETLSGLRGPIGIYIGSKTPPEIAVSVMAEIVATKNGVALSDTVQVALAKDRLMPEVLCASGCDAQIRRVVVEPARSER